MSKSLVHRCELRRNELADEIELPNKGLRAGYRIDADTLALRVNHNPRSCIACTGSGDGASSGCSGRNRSSRAESAITRKN